MNPIAEWSMRVALTCVLVLLLARECSNDVLSDRRWRILETVVLSAGVVLLVCCFTLIWSCC